MEISKKLFGLTVFVLICPLFCLAVMAYGLGDCCGMLIEQLGGRGEPLNSERYNAANEFVDKTMAFLQLS